MNVNRLDVAGIAAALDSDDETTRWKGAELAGALIEESPHLAWQLVLRFGRSENEDVRAAVATCVLEHLLEVKFDEFFPLLERELQETDPLLEDTFRLCWKLGVATEPRRSARWDELLRRIERHPRGDQSCG